MGQFPNGSTFGIVKKPPNKSTCTFQGFLFSVLWFSKFHKFLQNLSNLFLQIYTKNPILSNYLSGKKNKKQKTMASLSLHLWNNKAKIIEFKIIFIVENVDKLM